jgi:hypothetical protein
VSVHLVHISLYDKNTESIRDRHHLGMLWLWYDMLWNTAHTLVTCTYIIIYIRQIDHMRIGIGDYLYIILRDYKLVNHSLVMFISIVLWSFVIPLSFDWCWCCLFEQCYLHLDCHQKIINKLVRTVDDNFDLSFVFSLNSRWIGSADCSSIGLRGVPV